MVRTDWMTASMVPNGTGNIIYNFSTSPHSRELSVDAEREEVTRPSSSSFCASGNCAIRRSRCTAGGRNQIDSHLIFRSIPARSRAIERGRETGVSLASRAIIRHNGDVRAGSKAPSSEDPFSRCSEQETSADPRSGVYVRRAQCASPTCTGRTIGTENFS